MNVVENSDSSPFPGFRLYFDDVGSASGRTDMYQINIRESGGAGGSSVRIEGATGSARSGQWDHIFWSFTAGSATGLQLWINGAEDANSPINVSTIGDMGNSNGAVKFGETNAGGADRDGRIAECGFWNRVLTDPEIIALSKGFSPLHMRNGLVFYSDLGGKRTAEIDLRGGASGTVTGAVYVDHPRMMRPGSIFVPPFTVAAGGTTYPGYYGMAGWF